MPYMHRRNSAPENILPEAKTKTKGSTPKIPMLASSHEILNCWLAERGIVPRDRAKVKLPERCPYETMPTHESLDQLNKAFTVAIGSNTQEQPATIEQAVPTTLPYQRRSSLPQPLPMMDNRSFSTLAQDLILVFDQREQLRRPQSNSLPSPQPLPMIYSRSPSPHPSGFVNHLAPLAISRIDNVLRMERTHKVFPRRLNILAAMGMSYDSGLDNKLSDDDRARD
ncbi:hypothetical protein GCK72_025019 [Caenorhabditis remanei]|uniref:Uncharacterized protein n=1 Tax=Caenorhabditis remanei TaxID=31234 RepID=E3MRR8_CAERE|nr:hypothetical protein GCK72_025019 [Caenorhabditis remanei]EFP08025.1 hypothetical protein CRE_14795 [Caenorhabditis remanei]KAF1748552.1 hypothetical protein GCK72_025019 [Caenorhabditis remanei]